MVFLSFYFLKVNIINFDHFKIYTEKAYAITLKLQQMWLLFTKYLGIITSASINVNFVYVVVLYGF